MDEKVELTKEELTAIGKTQVWLDELTEVKGLFYSTIVHEVAMLRAIMSEAIRTGDMQKTIEHLVNFGALHTSALVKIGGFDGREREVMKDVDMLIDMSIAHLHTLSQPPSSSVH